METRITSIKELPPAEYYLLCRRYSEVDSDYRQTLTPCLDEKGANSLRTQKQAELISDCPGEYCEVWSDFALQRRAKLTGWPWKEELCFVTAREIVI